VQGQLIAFVFGHDDTNVRNSPFAQHSESIVAGGERAIPMIRYFQTAVRLLFDGGEKYVLDELGAHPSQRFMVGIPEGFLGGCRSGKQERGECHHQKFPGQVQGLHGISVDVLR
jgi:hypothetical protein